MADIGLVAPADRARDSRSSTESSCLLRQRSARRARVAQREGVPSSRTSRYVDCTPDRTERISSPSNPSTSPLVASCDANPTANWPASFRPSAIIRSMPSQFRYVTSECPAPPAMPPGRSEYGRASGSTTSTSRPTAASHPESGTGANDGLDSDCRACPWKEADAGDARGLNPARRRCDSERWVACARETAILARF